jgi:hypothetical protein
MTILWLILWLVQGTPHVEPWNAWLIALCVCIAFDLLFFNRRRLLP